MKTLRNWAARRSGAAIVIEGREADTGDAVKITRVERLQPRDGQLTVRDEKGVEWRLAL